MATSPIITISPSRKTLTTGLATKENVGVAAALDALLDTTSIKYPDALKVGAPTHIAHIQDMLDHSWSSGIVDGCALTNNGDGTISIAAGNATLRAANNPHSPLYNVEVIAQANIILTNDALNYILLTWNAGTPTFVATTSIAILTGTDNTIAYMVHRAGTLLHYADARNINVDNARKAAHMFLDFSRFIHAAEGSVLSGPSGLSIAVTAGHFYFMLNEIVHPAFDTTVAGTANVNTFTLWSHTAGAWVETINQKTCSTLVYDNGTNQVNLGNNKFGVTWFYIVNDSPSELHAILGTAEYPNIAEARIAQIPSILPSLISGMASLIGFVAYEKGATVFADIRSAFSQVFASSSPTTHNGLSGIQGGAVNDYQHLTTAQVNLVINALQTSAFTNAAVTGKLLTGFVPTAGIVADTDSILQAINKLAAAVDSSVTLAKIRAAITLRV